MQTYEYIVVTQDNKTHRVIADCMENVLKKFDEDETPIINIFRNNGVIEGDTYKDAFVLTAVEPSIAYTTGCRAYPNFPVQTKQGKEITLGASCSSGWVFDGWTVNGKSVGTTEQITLINQEAGDVTYIAHFKPIA